MNLTVSTIKDRDTQLQGCRHHRAGLTCRKITVQKIFKWRASSHCTAHEVSSSSVPLQALIICRTISAAPRLWSLDCWYRSLCFSVSFSCGRHSYSEHLTLLDSHTEFKQIEWKLSGQISDQIFRGSLQCA